MSCSVIHRHDYHSILLDEAIRLGAEIVVGQHVTKVDVLRDRVTTADGTEWTGNVIVGADGEAPKPHALTAHLSEIQCGCSLSRTN